ncbi:MAG: NAD-dependent epimerase/dehydratase family protein [Sumerlaeia bacterium]
MSLPFKRVLVTGGAGFIGSHMVDVLLEAGYEVRVFDSLDPQVHGEGAGWPEYLSPGAERLRGDIRDREALRRALDGVQAIVHDAAAVGVGQSQYEIHRYTDVNTGGTALLLDILANEKTAVERLLVASSMSIYGEGLYRRPSDGALLTPAMRPDAQMEAGNFEMHDPATGEELAPMPTPESKPLHCTSIYALSKKDQEEYCLVAGRAHGIPVVAGRFFNVYGPRQALSNPYTGVAAIFSSRIKNGHAPMIYEDGGQSRDFIHVRDLVEAKRFLLENEDATGRVFNICTGQPTSVLDMARVLARTLGRPEIEPQVLRSYRSGDIRHCFGDGSALAALGWRPRIALEDGIADLVAWAAEQQAQDHVDTAHAELVRRGLVRER